MKKLANITRGPEGWTVRVVRQGTHHSRYFRFSDGGIRKALVRAQEYRDQLIEELGERTWRKGPRKRPSNNTSGITGVSKNLYGRWVATWQEEGRQRFKTFKSKRDAVAHRKKMIAVD